MTPVPGHNSSRGQHHLNGRLIGALIGIVMLAVVFQRLLVYILGQTRFGICDLPAVSRQRERVSGWAAGGSNPQPLEGREEGGAIRWTSKKTAHHPNASIHLYTKRLFPSHWGLLSSSSLSWCSSSLP